MKDFTLNIYIAGSSADLGGHDAAVAAVRVLGFEVTRDWAINVRETRACDDECEHDYRDHPNGCPRKPNDAHLTVDQSRAAAKVDLLGILSADIVWYRIGESKSEGSAFEAGFAHALNIPLLVSGKDRRRCLFTSLGNVQRATDDEAVQWLSGLIDEATKRAWWTQKNDLCDRFETPVISRLIRRYSAGKP